MPKIARITRKQPITHKRKARKPALPEYLFWDFRYHRIDWPSEYRTVIERIRISHRPYRLESM